jgi:hypothetical protein
VIVFSATGLQRLLRLYGDYYENSPTHLSLAKDTPIPRAVTPPGAGSVIAIPQVGAFIIDTSDAPRDLDAPATRWSPHRSPATIPIRSTGLSS